MLVIVAAAVFHALVGEAEELGRVKAPVLKHDALAYLWQRHVAPARKPAKPAQLPQAKALAEGQNTSWQNAEVGQPLKLTSQAHPPKKKK